ncbi:saccharopine dehydrogenase NADP-binding domain-containing protein [Herbidospora daliensis]|uniref:saccharopine dehydrogenase NADP-binding domain-containing protein n=1 Tax=Herbidospora daliensis TaxID=295585 RepID=UPI000783B1FB|nr:saccharopine dehydrogenase NADP-binding domain-containing protein [Herbidospora daliensis]
MIGINGGNDEYRDRPGTGKPIVVIGGYGAVGGTVARQLGVWFPGWTVAAGRDLAKAESLARSTGHAVEAARIDVADPADVDRMLDDAAVVVMCVERANAELARECLSRGVHYVDVTASAPVVEAVASLDQLARRHGATAVLSVGVAPGLTNLLARHCVERLPSAETVDISLLLGQGGDHGVDSVRWIVENLVRPGRRRGARPLRVTLPDWGRRTVHPFPFSDQDAVSASLPVRATTRICLDSRVLTSALFGLRAAGFFGAVRRLSAESAFVSAFSRLRLGSDRFVVHVTASDNRGNAVSSTVMGRDVCRATGLVTARVARILCTASVPPGVLHIDRLRPAGALLDELGEYLLAVEHQPAY